MNRPNFTPERSFAACSETALLGVILVGGIAAGSQHLTIRRHPRPEPAVIDVLFVGFAQGIVDVLGVREDGDDGHGDSRRVLEHQTRKAGVSLNA